MIPFRLCISEDMARIKVGTVSLFSTGTEYHIYDVTIDLFRPVMLFRGG